MPRPRAGGVLGNGVRPCSEVLARGVLLEGIAYMGGIARTFPVLWLLFSFTKSPPARKFVGGRSGSGTTRPRARPRAECSTDSRCRSKPVVMAPQCKPRNGRAPSTPRVSSSSPQVRPAAVVPPRSVSSGKQLRGRIPGLRTLQHADFHILSTIASARAPSFGALHTASHMCVTRV